MADPRRESALADVLRPGAFGAVTREGPGVALSERRPAALLQVDGAPGEAALARALGAGDAAPTPRRAFEAGDGLWLWTGPGQWLVVAPEGSAPALRAEIEQALAGTDATVLDLSHARTIVRVAGARAVDVLAKGCPVDVDAMRAGDVASTLLGHLGVTVHCVRPATFDVLVMRSLGRALWEWLLEAAAEFGAVVEERVPREGTPHG